MTMYRTFALADWGGVTQMFKMLMGGSVNFFFDPQRMNDPPSIVIYDRSLTVRWTSIVVFVL